MKEKIIGRLDEQKVLQKIMDSKRAEFLAIFGRRRVGKTYLIKHFFLNKPCHFFQITGVKNGSMKEQLHEFTRAVEKTFYPQGVQLKEPSTWMQALKILSFAIEQSNHKNKVILFFDEIPWLATKRSRFLQALDYYWNTQWSDNARIRLIVCGSAASWVIKNIVNNKGGLHNRITAQIRLDAFSLYETKCFLKYRGIPLNDKQILALYMMIGGIPHYLNQIEKGLSAAQNIDQLCFTKNGLLFNEFNNLIPALFQDEMVYNKLIRLISKQRYGIDRREILKQSKHSSGGRLNQRLIELEEAGFIISFKPYGHRKRGKFYRIIDEYTLFYLNWIEPIVDSVRYQSKPNGYWENLSKSPAWKSWAGYAFEAICFKHIENIRIALHVPVTANIGTWRYIPKKGSDETGAQIDLLFDRDDDVVTLCEIKYSESAFEIDKKYAANLQNKIEVYKKKSGIEKQVFLAMVTSNGMKPTLYFDDLITNQATLADLFSR
ncbi:MAG: ATP-binding protein [Gammaproteobacteria bacterium]|nr:ATP-binding protein [Gammaproteobacteria bacterium]